MRLTAIGLAVGGALGTVLGTLIGSVVPGLRIVDPPLLLGVAATLTVVTLVSILLPARRATRVSPMVALRAE